MKLEVAEKDVATNHEASSKLLRLRKKWNVNKFTVSENRDTMLYL
jgi:hypothetical protein